MITYCVSTPSRLCLFGEHQDYLGLEVVALAIDLRFSAKIKKRTDSLIIIKIRDEKNGNLDDDKSMLLEEYTIDLARPILYENKRDYLKSCINVLLKEGFEIHTGFDITMNSTIPIGKGMCSSSTMIVVLIKAILEAMEHRDKDDPNKIASLAFKAEVMEFNEPGGMMDHYTSTLGDLVHLKFPSGKTIAKKINKKLAGCFILFDSLERKNTTQVLADSKIPTLEALALLKKYGVDSVSSFFEDENKEELLIKLDDFRKRKLKANIENYKILKEGLALMESDHLSPEKLGSIIYKHHVNLRDGLDVSTCTIEKIMDTALAAGGLGGKVNGSGGGGCLYVYANEQDAKNIIDAVKKIGFPGKVLHQDNGVRLDKIINS